MATMKEYVFNELGFFSEGQLEDLKEAFDGKTYMNFKIGYSNCAGNCTLIVSTDFEGTEEEIKNFFLSCAVSSLCNVLYTKKCLKTQLSGLRHKINKRG